MIRQITRDLDRLNNACLQSLLTIVQAMAENPANLRPLPLAPKRPVRLVAKSRDVRPSLTLEQPTHYFLTDPGGRTLHISQDLAQFLDATPEQFYGEGWEEFIDGTDELKRVLELFMVHTQKKEGFTYTVRCKTRLGRIEYVFVRVRPVTNHASVLTNFIGTVHPHILPARVLATQSQAG